MSLNATTGVVTGTLGLTTDEQQRTYPVTMTVADGSSSISQSFTWSVTPHLALVNPGAQGDASGDSVSLALTATDTSSTTLTYSASGLPSGLSIDASTGIISGTTGSDSPYLATVAVTDGTYSDSQTFTWNVAPLYLATPAAPSNLDDDTVSLSLAAAYHGSGTVSYSATGLPAGLGINPSTGSVTGTLTNTDDADSPYSVTVTATDGTDSATVAFSWAVDQRATVDTVADQTNVTGDSVSLTVTGEEESSDSVTWSYSASGLPSGLSIDSATGIISGTITASPSSTSDTVTVTASDGTGSASTTFDWTVVPVTLTAPADQASLGSATVSLALQADVASGYTASYSASGLPAGLSINSSTGVISGTLDSGATEQHVAGERNGDRRWRDLDARVLVDGGHGGGDAAGRPDEHGGRHGVVDGVGPGAERHVVLQRQRLAGRGQHRQYDGRYLRNAGGGRCGERPRLLRNRRGQQRQRGRQSNVRLDGESQDHRDGPGRSVERRRRLGVHRRDGQRRGRDLGLQRHRLAHGSEHQSGTGVISGTVATGDASVGFYGVDVTVSDGTYSADVWFGWTIWRPMMRRRC